MTYKSPFEVKKTFARIALCILIANNASAASTSNQTITDAIEKATTTEKTTPRVSAVEKKIDKFLRQQKRLMLVWLTASALYVTVDQYGKDNKLVVTAVDDALAATKRTWNNTYDALCSSINNLTNEPNSTTLPTAAQVDSLPSTPTKIVTQPASQEQAQQELKEAAQPTHDNTQPTLDAHDTPSTESDLTSSK